jgi:nitrate reductase gamma subunit
MVTQIIFLYLPYISAGIFAIGVLYRIWRWMHTPVPLRVVVTPAPRTRAGVLWRMAGDALWFPSLFKGDKLLWLASLFFHGFLGLVVLRHSRFFFYPVPEWVTGIQTIGLYAGYFIPLPLLLLLTRRLLMERNLYLSVLGDFFALFLLLSIAMSGILLEVFFRTYTVDVKALILGLVYLRPVIPEMNWLFGLHFLFIMVLMAYFPFGKLMHAGGLFFSPTRNQRANWERRFINPWDFPVSYHPLNLFPPEKYRPSDDETRDGEKK